MMHMVPVVVLGGGSDFVEVDHVEFDHLPHTFT